MDNQQDIHQQHKGLQEAQEDSQMRQQGQQEGGQEQQVGNKENNQDCQQYQQEQQCENNLEQEQYDEQQQIQQQCYEVQEYNYEQADYMQYERQQEKANIHKQLNQNAQYQMKELIKRIYKQTQQINDICCLGFDWSLILYVSCRWNISICSQLISNGDGKHKSIINYVKGFQKQQGVTEFKLCQVCYQQGYLLRNICGHQYCQACWVSHLMFNISQQPQSPYPRCMNQKCYVKISNTLSLILTESNQANKQKFIETLCRSYATNNSSVKMCKGRPGKNCNRCFTVQKLLSIIQCENCHNLVCPRCGERSHGVSQCDNLRRWNKLGQTTMGLIQYYSYQRCPKCNHGVQRIAGCNQMVCRCSQTFCYVCGKQWNPTHLVQNTPDYCPNYKQALTKHRFLKLRKKNNIIQFCFRIQDKRCQLLTFDLMLEQHQNLLQEKNAIIKTLLKNFSFHESELKYIEYYCTFNKKSICVLYGQSINDYFMKSQRSDYFCNILKSEIRKIRQFLIKFVQNMYKQIHSPQQQLTQEQIQQFKANKLKFYQQYFKKVKALDASKFTITKYIKQEFHSSIFDQDYLLNK